MTIIPTMNPDYYLIIDSTNVTIIPTMNPDYYLIIDSTNVTIIPTMNPDGFARSTEGKCTGKACKF